MGRTAHERYSINDIFTNKFTPEVEAILDRIKSRSEIKRRQLLQRFIEMAEPINLNVIPLKDYASVTSAIADLVRNKAPEWGDHKSIVAWKHPLIERLHLPDALGAQNVSVYVIELENDEHTNEENRAQLRQRIIDSYIGITTADYCMADTATLVMRTRPGQARSISLVPSIHVAVITLDQIIADLNELYALLKWDPEIKREGLTNCMTFISGPSKTADVEATMVHGAHGPREVYVYVVLGHP